jgi:2-polyprenyl-3-methyl-5-hydroxy-6-metoxy-1,4-benzoquinol methylase
VRIPTAKEYTHERLADQFETALSVYDTSRRVETLIDEFLTDEMVRHKRALDVGCGLGFFSQRLKERGANVIACDVGPTLVERTRQRVGCAGIVADVMQLTEQFGRDCFDLVVSSECVEHTPEPRVALRQMAAVLKPGGYIALSTPNLLWSPVVRAATALKLRPFDGHENFSSWRCLRKTLERASIAVVREQGLHLFPFQLGLQAFSTWCDRNLQIARGVMINICILGRKRTA